MGAFLEGLDAAEEGGELAVEVHVLVPVNGDALALLVLGEFGAVEVLVGGHLHGAGAGHVDGIPLLVDDDVWAPENDFTHFEAGHRRPVLLLVAVDRHDVAVEPGFLDGEELAANVEALLADLVAGLEDVDIPLGDHLVQLLLRPIGGDHHRNFIGIQLDRRGLLLLQAHGSLVFNAQLGLAGGPSFAGGTTCPSGPSTGRLLTTLAAGR